VDCEDAMVLGIGRSNGDGDGDGVFLRQCVSVRVKKFSAWGTTKKVAWSWCLSGRGRKEHEVFLDGRGRSGPQCLQSGKPPSRSRSDLGGRSPQPQDEQVNGKRGSDTRRLNRHKGGGRFVGFRGDILGVGHVVVVDDWQEPDVHANWSPHDMFLI